MAVYRNDQVDFSFAAEVGAGGYFAPLKASDKASGEMDTTTDAIVLPGATIIPVAATTNSSVGDYVQIGTTGTDSTEVRKITAIDSGVSIRVNAPVGFYHASGE